MNLNWILLFFVHQLLSFIGLAFAPTYLTRVAVVGLLAAVDTAALRDLVHYPLPDVVRYVYGCMFGALLLWDVYRLVLVSDPITAFRIRDQKPAQTLGEKMSWAQRVMSTARGIGLENQISGLRFPTSTSREFIFAGLKHVFLSIIPIIISYSALVLFELKWFFNPDGGQLPVLWMEVLRRLTITPLLLYSSYSFLNAEATLGSVASVAFGMASPSEWPPVFGPFWDEWTVAGCWSRTWHQLVKNPLAIWGEIVVTKLRIPPRSLLAHFTRVTLAFFFSGLFHSAGDYAVRGSDIFHNVQWWWSYKLFWSQPLAFLLEWPFIRWSKRTGFGRRYPGVARAVGSIWVIVWFSFTFVPFALHMFDDEAWALGEEMLRPLRETVFFTLKHSALHQI